MKKNVVFLFFILLTTASWCNDAFIAGKGATMDGSVIVTGTVESNVLFESFYHQPAALWPEGSTLEINDSKTGKRTGKIAQTARTYSVTGNTNEHQVTIFGTPFTCKSELVDSTGILDSENLTRITLQRARSARLAIRILTGLAKEYGYRDRGESFVIADANEAWILETTGKGPDYNGCVWAAVRVPDDCIVMLQTGARIGQITLDDPENCLYSEDVVSFARQQGYFDNTNKSFCFAEAYQAPGSIKTSPAEAKNRSRIFNSLRNSTTFTENDAPLFIKPDRKLTLQEILSYTRYNSAVFPSDFTTPCFVSQMRNWLPNPIGNICWFCANEANTSVYVPVYNGVTTIPDCFQPNNKTVPTFSWTSAYWIDSWVATTCYTQYDRLIGTVRALQDSLDSAFAKETTRIDQKASEQYTTDTLAALRTLTEFSTTKAIQATTRWKKLGEDLMVKLLTLPQTNTTNQ